MQVTKIRRFAFVERIVALLDPRINGRSGHVQTLRNVFMDIIFQCFEEENVKTIPAYAFYGCGGIKSITIPDSVTSIDRGTFYGCSGLTSITIPDRETCSWGTRVIIK